MQTVRETLDEGYCDVSGRVSDLINIGAQYFPTNTIGSDGLPGSMSDIRIFAARGKHFSIFAPDYCR